jgi:hypothetical protein
VQRVYIAGFFFIIFAVWSLLGLNTWGGGQLGKAVLNHQGAATLMVAVICAFSQDQVDPRLSSPKPLDGAHSTLPTLVNGF